MEGLRVPPSGNPEHFILLDLIQFLYSWPSTGRHTVHDEASIAEYIQGGGPIGKAELLHFAKLTIV